MKIGDLVTFIPSASSTFKWEKYVKSKAIPGIILRELNEKGTTTRRFEIRWHDGDITEEWISFLVPFDISLTA
mgnify:FL=1